MIKNKMEEKKKIKPFAAIVNIALINNGQFINQEEHNYILINEQKIIRINLIAAIVRKEQIGTITNMLLDDGSDKIIVRSFEENKKIDELKVGDVAIIIGKVRSYNQDIYISPEICKKVNPLWLKVRSIKFQNVDIKKKIIENINENKEIKDHDNSNNKEKIEEKENIKKITKNEEEITFNDIKKNKNDNLAKNESEELKENLIIENTELPFERILKLIDELDQGNGVMIEKIIEQSPLNDTENIIERMLEKGDIFQNQPGKIKLL